MSQEKSQQEKPQDPYQKYKDFKWQNPDQFKNGPIDDETRKCRDCICCIIFLVLFALCVVVAGFGFKKGKPSQLFYFYDDDGKPVVTMKDIKITLIYISLRLLMV